MVMEAHKNKASMLWEAGEMGSRGLSAGILLLVNFEPKIHDGILLEAVTFERGLETTNPSPVHS